MQDPWNWKTVFETFLGTAVGAAVGVGGIWWQTKQQDKSAYETRLTERLFESCEIFNNTLVENRLETDGRLPTLDSQSLRFKNISMLSNESDQEILLALSDICLELAGKSASLKREIIGGMMGAIAGWRSRSEERIFYVKQLNDLMVRTKTSY